MLTTSSRNNQVNEYTKNEIEALFDLINKVRLVMNGVALVRA